MKPRFLFPHRFKTIGWIITMPSLIFGLLIMFENLGSLFSINLIELNPFWNAIGEYIDEIVTVLLIIGMILIAFSKTKIEDEFVSKVRLESLQWAIYVSYALLILATTFIYGEKYFDAMIYNMFTPLLIFIIRFHYVLFINQKTEN